VAFGVIGRWQLAELVNLVVDGVTRDDVAGASKGLAISGIDGGIGRIANNIIENVWAPESAGVRQTDADGAAIFGVNKGSGRYGGVAIIEGNRINHFTGRGIKVQVGRYIEGSNTFEVGGPSGRSMMAQCVGITDAQAGHMTQTGNSRLTVRELTGGTSPWGSSGSVVALQATDPVNNELTCDKLSIHSAVDLRIGVSVGLSNASAGPALISVSNINCQKILKADGTLYTGAITSTSVVQFDASQAAAKATPTTIQLCSGNVSTGGKAVGYNGLGSNTAITQLFVSVDKIENSETQTAATRAFAPTGGSVITRTGAGAPQLGHNPGFWSSLPSGTLPDFAALKPGTNFAIDVPGGGVPGGWGSPPPVGVGTTLFISTANAWGGPGLIVVYAQQDGGGVGKEWSSYAPAAAGWNVR
jgi:hypothetical protein